MDFFVERSVEIAELSREFAKRAELGGHPEMATLYQAVADYLQSQRA